MFLNLNKAFWVKINSRLRRPPVQRNTPGQLGMEQLLCHIAGGYTVFITEAVFVLTQIRHLHLVPSPPSSVRTGNGATDIVPIGSGRMNRTPLIERIKGCIPFLIGRIADHEGAELLPNIHHFGLISPDHRQTVGIAMCHRTGAEPIQE